MAFTPAAVISAIACVVCSVSGVVGLCCFKHWSTCQKTCGISNEPNRTTLPMLTLDPQMPHRLPMHRVRPVFALPDRERRAFAAELRRARNMRRQRTENMRPQQGGNLAANTMTTGTESPDVHEAENFPQRADFAYFLQPQFHIHPNLGGQLWRG
jgi:hypothetical protein